MTDTDKGYVAVFATIIVVVVAFALLATNNTKKDHPAASTRPLVTLAPPLRDFGATMDYARSPNLIVTTPGTDSGLPPARVFTTIRFSIDGKLVKTRTAPPYTITTLPAGSHIVTLTGTASGGDNARIQESYIK